MESGDVLLRQTKSSLYWLLITVVLFFHRSLEQCVQTAANCILGALTPLRVSSIRYFLLPADKVPRLRLKMSQFCKLLR